MKDGQRLTIFLTLIRVCCLGKDCPAKDLIFPTSNGLKGLKTAREGRAIPIETNEGTIKGT